jgi:glycosyltransferase-like protein
MRSHSIALYTYASQPRGSVVHTAGLADALQEAGHDVHVYALDKGEGFYRPLRAALHLIPTAPAPTDVAGIVEQRRREFVDYLSGVKHRHDLHHAQDCLAASALLDLRALGSTIAPIVRTVHHIERFSDPYLTQCQTRSIVEADACLAVSEATRAELDAMWGIDAARVLNGVDSGRFVKPDIERREALRHRLALGPGPVFLSLGGIEPRKNTLACLAAFRTLRSRGAQWIIAGGASVLDHTEYVSGFEAAFHALTPADRKAIHRPGVIPEEDMPALFQIADVLLAPSLQEGWGLTVLEAMAAGCPVVASRRPPFTEYLDDETAELVDPESVEAIAAGVVSALGEPRRTGMIRHAQQRASEYDWRRAVALHEDAYRRVMDVHSNRQEVGAPCRK